MISGFLIAAFVVAAQTIFLFFFFFFFLRESLHSIKGLNKFKLGCSASFLTEQRLKSRDLRVLRKKNRH